MEFLKKHYEKIAMAVVSLLMIGTAVMLVNKLGFGGQEHPGVDRAYPKPLSVGDVSQMDSVLKGTLLGSNDLVWIGALLENPHIDQDLSARLLDTNEMMQIATLLRNPPAWRTNDGPRPFIPEPWKWDGKDLTPVGEAPPPPPTPADDPANDLNWTVASRTFPMKFMGVASEVGTNKVFQINIAGTGSRFVKIGDRPIRLPIYGVVEEFTVLRYEEKRIEWFNTAVGAKQVADVSVLTVRRKSPTEVKEIALVIGKQILDSEPVARYQTITGERSGDLKKGSKFTYKGKPYELLRLDIIPALVVFKDIQTQKEYRRRPSVVQRF